VGTYVDRLLAYIDIKVRGLDSVEKMQKKLDRQFSIQQKRAEGMTGLFKRLQNVLLGMGLAFMFTGMAIRRATENALRGLLQTFLLVEGEGGIVNNSVNQLRASWEFLKYSIVDAARQTGVFDKWLDRANRLLNWFNSFSPEFKAFLFDTLVVGLLIGAAMMLIGQALLFTLGPLALIAFLFEMGLLAPLVGVLVVLGLVIAVIAIWHSNLSMVQKVAITILAVAILIGLALWAGPAIAIAAIIGLTLLALVAVWKWRDAIEYAGYRAGLAIRNFLGSALQWVADKLNSLIAMFESITGKTFGRVKIGFEKVAPMSFEEYVGAFRPESQKGAVSTNKVLNINNYIEGSVGSEDLLDKLTDQLVQKINFENGSPQT